MPPKQPNEPLPVSRMNGNFPHSFHPQNQYLLRLRSSKYGFLEALRAHEKKKKKPCVSLTWKAADDASSGPPKEESLGDSVLSA